MGCLGCSTPIFASVIALLNDERIAAGKSPLGFLNPLLYSTGASALHDITAGAPVYALVQCDVRADVVVCLQAATQAVAPTVSQVSTHSTSLLRLVTDCDHTLFPALAGWDVSVLTLCFTECI